MIKIALPAGDLRSPVADALISSGLHVEGYGEGEERDGKPCIQWLLTAERRQKDDARSH